jgi:hypothetical protein
VASGVHPGFYEFTPARPSPDDIYDFAAIEELRLEDVGRAWASDADDGIPNIRKLFFGLHPALPLYHPRNAAGRSRLPRLVPAPPGVLEMRCRPDPEFLPEGNPVLAIPHGEASMDLTEWQPVTPVLIDGGELVIRHPGDTRAGFLRWEVFAKRPPGP